MFILNYSLHPPFHAPSLLNLATHQSAVQVTECRNVQLQLRVSSSKLAVVAVRLKQGLDLACTPGIAADFLFGSEFCQLMHRMLFITSKRARQ